MNKPAVSPFKYPCGPRHTLGPVQTPNFLWAEPYSNQGRLQLFRPAEVIQTLILIPAELYSKGEKFSFQSNCLQNAL